VAAYYNEFDPFAAAWLRELIKDGLIADGEVDERSIKEVQPDDVKGFTQCHFFAGIGGWSLALRLAGWDDGRPIWTGSCPCQPFSDAGQKKGEADPRHLWPDFRRLIAGGNPATIFGEQVASAPGRLWLARVRADLEEMAYGVGCADLCAAGIGAPHIRQRLFWMGHAPHLGIDGRRAPGPGRRDEPANDGDAGGLHDAPGTRQQPAGAGSEAEARDEARLRGPERGRHQGWGSTWIACGDGKSRRVEPSIPPLADGLPGRVGLLRGAGNAIIPQLAAEFIQAADEAMTAISTNAA
jgi:DNA (cytosine-5)-methyltransferase 1